MAKIAGTGRRTIRRSGKESIVNISATRFVLALFAAVMVVLATSSGTPVSAAGSATGPGQPTSGPGGSDEPWGSYRVQHVQLSDPSKDYWTFEPSDWQGTGPAPKTAPLVIFLHGWLGYDPKFYQDWIVHLVREGNVIIFPRYQTSATTPPKTFTTNALYSIDSALRKLAHARVRPATSQGMMLVGHSWGGPVAVNIANRWSQEKLPKPKALMLAEPFSRTLDASLAGIPSKTKIDCVVGDSDTTVGRNGCDTIWSKITQLPAADHDYIWMYDDDHGAPGLVADHRAPTSNTRQSSLDALDWYGFWKLADGLRDCTFTGSDCAYATGRTGQEAYMGDWSDGVAVHPLAITTGRPACPTGSGAKGC